MPNCVAALYDIHGNVTALEAVVAEINRIDVDAIVFGGDVVSGPLPAETLTLLRQLPGEVIVIRGNADREVVEAAQSEQTALERDDIEARRTRFVAECLDSDALTFLGELPLTQVLEIEGFGPTLFCHATPRHDDETFTERSPHERIATIMADVGESVIVCGHTHMQFNLSVAWRRIINAGSVGHPYEGRPGAYWALFTDGSLELRRTDYDYAEARQLIAASGFPFADLHVADLFDAPPSREDALAVFEPDPASRAGSA